MFFNYTFKMKNILFFIIVSFYSIYLLPQSSNNQDLPVLGDYSSSSISLSGEHELGRIWLSMYRSVIKEHDDPMIRTYLEDLLYRLSEDKPSASYAPMRAISIKLTEEEMKAVADYIQGLQ